MPRKNDPRKGNEVKSRRFPHICVPHFPTSDKKRIQENERNTREFWKEPGYDILLAIFC